jgi:riboflavin synthase alpha subunit
MADSSQPDNQGPQSQQVNLQQIAQQFMVGLQRHFDMLAFNLAARERVAEEDYDRLVHAPKIMPAARSHQNFEQMQAYARDLLMRQVIGDGMNLTVTALNNAHFFLALVKATKANSQVSPEAQNVAKQAQDAYVSAPLDQKFNKLEQDYGIMCELEDSITSLGFCLQALLHQQGMVKEAQVDENGELVIELKALKVLSRGANSDQVKGKLVDQRKVFKEGESVLFSDLELQLVLVTVASFADALFKSVSQYAKSVKDQAE